MVSSEHKGPPSLSRRLLLCVTDASIRVPLGCCVAQSSFFHIWVPNMILLSLGTYTVSPLSRFLVLLIK